MNVPADDRRRWTHWLCKLATPVLEPLARGRLRATMPVEHHPRVAREDRAQFTHLEAVGRLLCGVAPWLESTDGDGEESALRQTLLGLALEGLEHATDPASADFLNFSRGNQPVVDAAFLAQAILRAPRTLADGLDPTLRRRVGDALESTRPLKPYFNNWLLFSATIEAALHRLGRWADPMRIDYALRQHEQWYKGDAIYADGPAVHVDYYNSFVIHPMLVDILEAVHALDPHWAALRPKVLGRARRLAEVLERCVSPEGTIPPLGRSLAYRCGALHALAQSAAREDLPETLKPAAVRGAISAVIERMLGAPGTFDAQGYLRIGLVGHQPSLGETYISTGSLYLCATALLPLGLPPGRPFWADPPTDWTARRLFAGHDLPADRAIVG